MTGTITYLASFGLGAMHALEPGHGKSFIASYMLGERLKVKNLFAMLGTLLVSHFLLLTVLALLVKYVFSGISQEYLLSIQEWVAPAVIFAFGLFLFLRYRIKGHSHGADCNCGLHAHNHPQQGPAATSKPGDFSNVSFGQVKAVAPSKPSRNPAIVGLITGLVPCPSALAPVFLSATASFDNVILLIAIYVIGMILVLAGFVAAFYLGKRLIGPWLDQLGSRVNLHLVSAVLIMIVGLAYFSFNMVEHFDPEHVHMHAGHLH